MSDCVQSINVICKHVEDTETFYADFAPRLGTGETISSVAFVTPEDASLTASSAAVLTGGYTDTKTIRDEQGNSTTITYVIAANKGVSFVLTGGTSGGGCKRVTVQVVKSTGKTATLDCLVEVHGVDV